MTTARQPNLSRGELAEAMYARVDTVDYATGLRGLRNHRILRTGGVESRSGFRFVDETRFPSKKSRLLPFSFNIEDGNTYAIEMGDNYFEFLQNGARIVLASQSITAISKANPCVVTYAGADTYANGDDVIITGGDMPEIIGRRFRVAGLNAGANTFQLQHTDGTNLDSSAFTTYTGGASVAEIYMVAGGFLEADLPKVSFAQSADVVTFACKGYTPKQLTRFGATNWTIDVIKFCGEIARSAGIAAAVGAAGAQSYDYVTTVVSQDGEEVLNALRQSAATAITAATKANPVQITAAGHGLQTGDTVYIYGVNGMTELNGHDLNLDGRDYTVVRVDANNVQLVGEDGTAYNTYVNGGTMVPTFYRLNASAVPTLAVPNTVTITGVAGAAYYNIYRKESGIYGLIGSTAGTTFLDIGDEPDTGKTPPLPHKLFLSIVNDDPECVTYAQQRLWFGGSEVDPTTMWGSQIGHYKNFYTHTEPLASDPVTINLAGPQVNQIKHLLELSKVLAFTAASEKSVSGDSDGAITPNSPVIKTESYSGCSGVAPVIADSNVIFVQRDQSIVRDQAFDWQVNGYRGKDLTTRSSHLFDGRTIDSLCFQKAPIQTVWMIRDDGILLAMTYLREEELIGISRNDTDGIFESMCTVTEGTEEAVYVIVKRTRSGPGPTTRRYVERLETRFITDLKDALCMDSAKTYDGRHRSDGINVRIEGGVTWLAGEALTVRASSGTPFAASDVGKAVFVYGLEAVHGIKIKIRCTITGFTSSTEISVVANHDIPAGLQTVYTTDWDLAAIRITGLWHLEGKSVAVLLDGGVYASPNNAEVETIATVANGVLDLSEPGGVVSVGLPFFCDVETLDLDTIQGEPLIGKKKLVKSVWVYVKELRQLWAGPKPPTDDDEDPLEELEEHSPANVDDPVDEPPPLQTGVIKIRLQSHWNSNGRVFLRIVDPVPGTILAIAPSGVIPARG